MDSKEVLREQWKKYVAEWKASGKSCSQWATEQSISYHSLLYWRQKYGEATPTASKTFVELKDPPSSSGIVLEIAGVTIHVNPSFDPSTLMACVELLRKLSC